METEIVVEYLKANGNTVTEKFKSWDESGSFTLLYNDVSHDSLRLMIPTQNILSLRVVTEEDREEEDRAFVESYVNRIILSGSALVDKYLLGKVEDLLNGLQRKYETKEIGSDYYRVSLVKG